MLIAFGVILKAIPPENANPHGLWPYGILLLNPFQKQAFHPMKYSLALVILRAVPPVKDYAFGVILKAIPPENANPHDLWPYGILLLNPFQKQAFEGFRNKIPRN
ncbi:hypothetical protein [Robiginitalea sp. SC105]|uniref:hypothetical protein n=1 Tax=Robiginitalea sp. SC105 TaxID=2762332 RepID=UPI0016395662|nr:hypothetical protein [Robiginitalea sp. SC105]MBC2840267.1 hypothetical protein [Robiginitalea sp. SC105]